MFLRIVVLALVVSLLCRWALGKWPWHFLSWPDNPHDQAVARARQLLSVENGASRDDILAAHKRLIAMVHPDRGGSNAAVHEANAARDLLLHELPAEKTEKGQNRDES